MKDPWFCIISEARNYGKKVRMTKGKKSEKVKARPVWIWPAIGKGILTGGLIAWLFFQSAAGLVCVPFSVAVTMVKEKKSRLLKNLEREQECFVEYLGFLKEALMVGYSLEQAVGEGKKGILTTRKEEDVFVQEISRMEKKMQLGTPVETVFSEWAAEALCEDIRDFSEVLFIAKRTGGAVQQVIENTERVIRDKQETMRYIRSVLHSREYEAKVMKVMPFAMLLYLQLFMADFIKPLYHNTVGVCVMTVVLLVYLGLCFAVDSITAVSL